MKTERLNKKPLFHQPVQRNRHADAFGEPKKKTKQKNERIKDKLITIITTEIQLTECCSDQKDDGQS